MAEGAPGQPVEIDPDFEPLSRPRSCTWPLPRPELLEPVNSNTSSPAPSLHQEPLGNGEYISNLALLEEDYDEYTDHKPPLPCSEYQGSRILHHHAPSQQLLGAHLPTQQQVSTPGTTLGGPCSISQRKSSSSRRNAWGNMSYADLITKAIESSPEKRLTLSQIYDWMVKSVPYFNDKGDSNSSAGWKNSIRHNLSLHSRFVRIQNEGTGKSSWWMLNPEGGKNGKSPRRRAASMDNNSKFTKSKGRATKKKMAVTELAEGGAHSPNSSQYSHWLGSPHSQSTEDLDSWCTFRTRTSSDASTLSGRRSPFPPEQDDVGDPDMHLGYTVMGPKLTSTLPRLSEVSISQPGSERVMEGLLDNLNLLSPQLASSDSSPHSSNTALLQNSPYASSHHKTMYNQVKMNSMLPMQTLPENKAAFGTYENCYGHCPPGLLKDLLTTNPEPSREMMSPSHGLMSPYNSQTHIGTHNEVKMISPSHPITHIRSLSLQNQGPVASRDLNSCNMIPLTGVTSLAGGPPRMSSLRISTQLPHHGHPAHGHNIMVNRNGYTELALVHPRGHHQERLPSDLDNMSLERFECDMESVLHDTLMDGGALDFNFDPAAGAQGFVRGKNTSHGWVSG